MAKVNCCICNAEVGLFKQIKMADGKFICRDCAEKTAKIFVQLFTQVKSCTENTSKNWSVVKRFIIVF